MTPASKGARRRLLAKWTPQEDGRLRALIQSVGVKRWTHIAQQLPGRTGKQVGGIWGGGGKGKG
jgi:hypothetical protein